MTLLVITTTIITNIYITIICAANELPTDTGTHTQPLESYKTTEAIGLPKRRPLSLLFCNYTI